MKKISALFAILLSLTMNTYALGIKPKVLTPPQAKTSLNYNLAEQHKDKLAVNSSSKNNQQYAFKTTPPTPTPAPNGGGTRPTLASTICI